LQTIHETKLSIFSPSSALHFPTGCSKEKELYKIASSCPCGYLAFSSPSAEAGVFNLFYYNGIYYNEAKDTGVF
jgi:hypothetical protein